MSAVMQRLEYESSEVQALELVPEHGPPQKRRRPVRLWQFFWRFLEMRPLRLCKGPGEFVEVREEQRELFNSVPPFPKVF